MKKFLMLFIVSMILPITVSAEIVEYRIDDFYGEYYPISIAFGRVNKDGTISPDSEDIDVETLIQNSMQEDFDHEWLDTESNIYELLVKIIKNTPDLAYDKTDNYEEAIKDKNPIVLENNEILINNKEEGRLTSDDKLLYDICTYPFFELDITETDGKREFILFDLDSVYKVAIGTMGDYFVIRYITKDYGEIAPHLNLSSLQSNEDDEDITNPIFGSYFEYHEISYEDIMRDREGFYGKRHKFRGEIIQYEEVDDVASGLVIRDGDLDQIYQVFWPKLPDYRFLKGDIVDVEGLLMGLHSYERVAGGYNTTPLIAVEHIYIDGEEY